MRTKRSFGVAFMAAAMSLTALVAHAQTADTTNPTVSAVTPTSANLNAATTYTATYSDSVGVTGCDLYLDGANQGAMTLAGSLSGTATKSATLTVAGNHTLQARCRDAAGNVGLGATTTVTTIPPGPDATDPNVGGLTPSGATLGTATVFSATFSDALGVTSCELYINGTLDGAMTLAGTTSGTATRSHTFTANGSYTLQARCRDLAGNVGLGASTIVTVPPTQGLPGQTSFSLERMEADAVLLLQNDRAALEVANGRGCEFSDAEARTRSEAILGALSGTSGQVIVNFMGCGSPSSLHLGAGERLGVVNSYRAAYGRLPSTQAHWFDAIKIGNGRYPSEISASAEASAKTRFRTIYLRDANMSANLDANAVVIMAYGLRPLPRSVSSEAQAIGFYQGIFGHLPMSATDWDALRAIAYSGATR